MRICRYTSDADGHAAPRLIHPTGGWSRPDIADWIAAQAGEDILIGLDLSPAFPLLDAGAYFPGWHRTPRNARGLWALVDDITAQDPHFGVSSFVAHPELGRHFRQRGNPGDLHPPGTTDRRVGHIAIPSNFVG